MSAKGSTVLAIFGDLRIGALFEHRGGVYRKVTSTSAVSIDPDTGGCRFASFESVRAAAFIYG